MDTSPKHRTKVVLLKPPGLSDHLTDVTRFLKELAQGANRFITFVDSRKQTELITSILSRGQSSPGQDDDLQDDNQLNTDTNYLKTLNILPYRAGYEEEDQLTIQDRLSHGSLKGLVSTSALELGLDIKHLDVAVLLGVPYSSTSLWQRIGRIGRHSSGVVYVIHSGGVYDDLVFSNPDRLLNRPLAQGALYLQNVRIQYIHALCLSRENGEHDRFCNALNLKVNEDDFTSLIDWPKGFLALCKSERIGEIAPDLQAMKSEVNNDNPNIIYPLRDVESQFKVTLKQGPIQEDKGSLSYSQLLREAYPGAVYYYATEAFRVHKVFTRTRTVYVRKEKKYTTLPIPLQSVYPNLNSDNIYEARLHGDLLVIESNVQVRESILGFKEKRGPREAVTYSYPLNGSGINVFFDMQRFTRIYFTSGVIFTHPKFNGLDRKVCQAAARLVYEAFLMSIPFERQDIDVIFEKHRARREPHVQEGALFIAIYDRTYGSLRLSGHVMAEDSMCQVFKQALDIANISDEVVAVNETLAVTSEVIGLLESLYAASITPGKKVVFDLSITDALDDMKFERVIMPGSIGLALRNDNAEYRIEGIFFRPNGLCYRGKYVNQPKVDDSDIIWSIKDIAESPGESVWGYYNYETGEVVSGD